eukprot:GHVU01041094.1.p1 GENE.GHVU01041094.1~~GHVU01041094.1.p1  ORF type:complete len:421 (+),score=38.87 GHVU01041094.1:275-1537(+)
MKRHRGGAEKARRKADERERLQRVVATNATLNCVATTRFRASASAADIPEANVNTVAPEVVAESSASATAVGLPRVATGAEDGGVVAVEAGGRAGAVVTGAQDEGELAVVPGERAGAVATETEDGGETSIKDIGEWPIPATESLREQCVSGGNVWHQVPPPDVLRRTANEGRTCPRSVFEGRRTDGGTFERSWLCLSLITMRLYCVFCKLFSKNPAASKFASDGFCDWKHACPGASHHESSSAHREAVITFRTRAQRMQRIDLVLIQQEEQQRAYWETMLRRMLDVICFIGERGLAFRGTSQEFGNHSNGNYLGILELIAKYDQPLAHHIEKYGNKGRGNVSYTSGNICNELIEIVGNKVLSITLERIRRAAYYTLTVDSTPDCARIDQLTVVVRYLEGTEPVERFLTFLESVRRWPPAT